MAKYTLQLNDVCDWFNRETVESWFKDYNLEDYLTAEEIAVIDARGTWSKDRLAREIVDNYLYREIGSETPAMFKHLAKIEMRKVMEKKLPLIYSASIKYDPLVNVDFKEIYTGNQTSDGTSESNSASSGLGVNSDTPQGQINKTDILGGKYATSTGASEGESTDKSKSSGTSAQTYERHTIGNSGVSATAQAMVKQYRQNIVAINEDIIDALNSLFMGVF